MLKIDCLLKNTDIADDLRSYVKYIAGIHAKTGMNAGLETIYTKLRKSGVEADLGTIGAIYDDVLPRDDANFTSRADIEKITGRSFDDYTKNLLLRNDKTGEHQIGDLSPAEAIAKNITEAFTNNVVEDNTTKSILRTMQDALLQEAKKVVGALPNEKKGEADTRSAKEIIQQAIEKNALGYENKETGQINGFTDLWDATKKNIQKINDKVSASGDPLLEEQWNNYTQSVQDHALNLMFSTKEGKKVLEDALMSKEAGYGKTFTDGTQSIDWKKLAGGKNDYDTLRANVVKAFKAQGYDEDMSNKIADSLSKEFENLQNSIAKKNAPKTTETKTVFNDLSALFKKDAKGMPTGDIDEAAIPILADAKRAKMQYENMLQQADEKKLSWWKKAHNLIVSVYRAGLLSNPLILGKLLSAGGARIGMDAVEGGIKGGYSLAFSHIPALAPLSKGSIGEGGGYDIKRAGESIAHGYMNWAQDAKAIMGTKNYGKSDLQLILGKYGDLPPEAGENKAMQKMKYILAAAGRTHSLMKAPIWRSKFEMQLAKRLSNTISNGGDVTNPVVLTAIATGAKMDADRAIFMQENKVLQKLKPATNSLLGELIVPFPRVGFNIAAEAGKYIYGLPVGAYKIIQGLVGKDGLSGLTEEQKDSIMRHVSKGTIGLGAAVAWAYFHPQNFGGGYIQGQHKKKDDDGKDIDYGDIVIDGNKIPKTYLEAPVFQAMQAGADYRHVIDLYNDETMKGDGFEKYLNAAWIAGENLMEGNPYVGSTKRIGAVLGNKKEREYFIDEMISNAAIPGIFGYAARVGDPRDEGGSIRKLLAPRNERKAPTTLEEHFKSKIPGLREDLEEKEPPEDQ